MIQKTISLSPFFAQIHLVIHPNFPIFPATMVDFALLHYLSLLVHSLNNQQIYPNRRTATPPQFLCLGCFNLLSKVPKVKNWVNGKAEIDILPKV